MELKYLEKMNELVLELTNDYYSYMNKEEIMNNKVEQLTNLVIDFLSDKDKCIVNEGTTTYIHYKSTENKENYHSDQWQYIFKKMIEKDNYTNFIAWLCKVIALEKSGIDTIDIAF